MTSARQLRNQGATPEGYRRATCSLLDENRSVSSRADSSTTRRIHHVGDGKHLGLAAGVELLRTSVPPLRPTTANEKPPGMGGANFLPAVRLVGAIRPAPKLPRPSGDDLISQLATS